MPLRSHENFAHSNETQRIFYQLLYSAWYFENETLSNFLIWRWMNISVNFGSCKAYAIWRKVQHMIYLVMSKVWDQTSWKIWIIATIVKRHTWKPFVLSVYFDGLACDNVDQKLMLRRDFLKENIIPLLSFGDCSIQIRRKKKNGETLRNFTRGW